MTHRSLPEWIGATADTEIPARVRLRVWDRCKGLCHKCGRKIRGAIERWICEHLIALINWRPTDEKPHGNRESNLGLTCCNCLPVKNAEDVAEKAEVYAIKSKHLGLKKASRPFPGSRASGLKKHMDGSVSRR